MPPEKKPRFDQKSYGGAYDNSGFGRTDNHGGWNAPKVSITAVALQSFRSNLFAILQLVFVACNRRMKLAIAMTTTVKQSMIRVRQVMSGVRQREAPLAQNGMLVISTVIGLSMDKIAIKLLLNTTIIRTSLLLAGKPLVVAVFHLSLVHGLVVQAFNKLLLLVLVFHHLPRTSTGFKYLETDPKHQATDPEHQDLTMLRPNVQLCRV